MSSTTQSSRTKSVAFAALYVFIIAAMLIFVGCSSDNSVGSKPADNNPDPTVTPDTNVAHTDAMPEPDCARNNTAQLLMTNDSHRTTFRVIVDEQMVGSIKPGGSVSSIVSVGTHTVKLYYTDGVLAYSQITEPAICELVSIRYGVDEAAVQPMEISNYVRLR
jgi:hypothetical protein